MDVTLERLFSLANTAHDNGTLAAFSALCAFYAEKSRLTFLARLRLKPETRETPNPADHFNLTATEAAPLVGMSPRWLYEHAPELAYAKRHGNRSWRFSREAIEREAKKR